MAQRLRNSVWQAGCENESSGLLIIENFCYF